MDEVSQKLSQICQQFIHKSAIADNALKQFVVDHVKFEWEKISIASIWAEFFSTTLLVK